VIVLPTATYTSGEFSVTVWSTPIWCEVLLTRPPNSLPPGMAVTDAMAAVWRVDGWQGAVIKCRWASGVTWSEAGPENGENLSAQTWSDGQTKVTIGLPEYEIATTCRSDGFEVAIGSVGSTQGHFVWAWGPDSPDDISTWFAVDWPTARLIALDSQSCTATESVVNSLLRAQKE
jgi:hypothetical protein